MDKLKPKKIVLADFNFQFKCETTCIFLQILQIQEMECMA